MSIYASCKTRTVAVVPQQEDAMCGRQTDCTTVLSGLASTDTQHTFKFAEISRKIYKCNVHCGTNTHARSQEEKIERGSYGKSFVPLTQSKQCYDYESGARSSFHNCHTLVFLPLWSKHETLMITFDKYSFVLHQLNDEQKEHGLTWNQSGQSGILFSKDKSRKV